MMMQKQDRSAEVVRKLIDSMTDEQIRSLLDHFAASADDAREETKPKKVEEVSDDH